MGTSGSEPSSAAAIPGSATGGVFPLRQLCVVEGKAAWSLSLDVYILSADGSVFDTVLLASIAALTGTQVHILRYLFDYPTRPFISYHRLVVAVSL